MNADGSQDVNQYGSISGGEAYLAGVIHYDPTGLLESKTDYDSGGDLIGSQHTTRGADDSTTTIFKDADGKVYDVALTGGGVTTETSYDDTGTAVSVRVSVDPAASYTGSADRLFVSAHWNSIVTLAGSLSEVDGSGSGATVNLAGTDETVFINSATVTLWNAASATIDGDGNIVVLNDDDTVTVSGAGNTAVLQGTGNSLTIASAAINVFNDAAGTITGDGNTLAVYAEADVTVNGEGTTATFYDANSSVTMTGTNADAEVASTSETIVMTSGQAHFWNGTSGTVTGDGNNVVLNDDDTVTVSGTGGTATIQGTGDRLAIASGRVTLANGAAAAVTGNGNIMTVFDGVALTASGTDDSFVFSATPATATISGYNLTDSVQFSSSTFADWHSLLSHASQQGADTVIQTDPTHSVTLVGITLSGLDQNHFRFV